MANDISPRRRELGLVAHYTFDHSDVRDSTDYTNDGTVSGTASVAGGVLNIGLSTGLAVVSDTADHSFTGDYSLSCWVKFTALADNRVIVAKGQNASGDAEYAVQYQNSTGRIIFFVWGATLKIVTANTFGSISTDTWYHVSCVYDDSANSGTIYVNTVSDTITPFEQRSDTPYGLGIGGWSAGVTKHTYGKIDDVRLYKRALTQAEIQYLYQTTRGDHA